MDNVKGVNHGSQIILFEVMTSTSLGSVASLLAATLYQGNPDRNHKFWNVTSAQRYILHMQLLLKRLYV
jgi:hypothetical protein